MASQETNVGQAPGTNMRRFLVGPKECEITGIDSTPDGRALFVNIQHPGEDGNSNWPASQSDNSASSRPRSATIVITKDEAGIVALYAAPGHRFPSSGGQAAPFASTPTFTRLRSASRADAGPSSPDPSPASGCDVISSLT